MSSEITPLLASGDATRNGHHGSNRPVDSGLGTPPEGALTSGTLISFRLLITALTTYIGLYKSQGTRGILNSWRTSNEKECRRIELAEETQRLWAELVDGLRSDDELVAVLWSPVAIEEGSDKRTCNSSPSWGK